MLLANSSRCTIGGEPVASGSPAPSIWPRAAMSRPQHLNLIDLMAAIAAGALPLYLLQGAWIAPWYALLMVAAPLAGALAHRSRGGRGITGGTVGGLVVLGAL